MGTFYTGKVALSTAWHTYKALKTYVVPKLSPWSPDFVKKYGKWTGRKI